MEVNAPQMAVSSMHSPTPSTSKRSTTDITIELCVPQMAVSAMHSPPHLAPVMRFAMKVNIAAQMMSRTVAAFLYTLLSRGSLIVTFILL
jgi:hypothetical protein